MVERSGPSERVQTILENKHRAQLESVSHKTDGVRGGWKIHDQGLQDYGGTFFDVDRRFYTKIMEKLTEPQSKKSILDLGASDAAVLQAVEKGYDYGLAVSLGYPPTPGYDRKSGIVDTVNGDLLSYRTWLEIKRRMQEQGFKEGFDTIVSRPQGGLTFLTYNESAHYWMFQHMWRLLNPDSGLMYFQAPHFSFTSSEDYFTKLKKEVGINMRWEEEPTNVFGRAVTIQKKWNDPQQLPTPRSFGIR